MNRLILSFGLVLAAAAGAQPAITNIVLNPREVIEVAVATDRLSMIVFPSAISHLEGAYLSTDADPPARFQVNFKSGNSYFTVRALSTSATAALTVVWKRKTFVFELVASPRPLLALTLVEPVARDATAIATTGVAPSAHRLLGILDTAKAYPLLHSQHPDEVADVVFVPKHDRYDLGTYEFRVEKLFQFKAEDTLVFRVVFQNKSNDVLHYRPQSFRVRVGARIFYAAIADGDGLVPPLSQSPVYFAIATAPDGSRPGLSPQNDFSILFTLAPSEPARPGPAPKRNSGGVTIPRNP